MSSEQYSDALPPGSHLLWYEIMKVLGKGGFGVTYLGRDTNLDQLVAIKEYMPAGIAIRDDKSAIKPNSPADQETYLWGLERFLREAQTLARFKHPSIVRVLSFFRDRNTAYMVMEFEEGEALDSVLKRRKIIPEHELKRILPPLLDGIETLHKADYIHRDLKPANIFIRNKDGTPVILDFGSARQAIMGQAQQMTSLLSMGYSPFEQYDSSGNRQGPWSDIYSMGGVLYRSVTAQKPVDAAIRIAAKLRNEPDPLKSAVDAALGRYSRGFLQAIDKALSVLETDRPQSIAAWRPMLVGTRTDADDDNPNTLIQPQAAAATRSEEPPLPAPSEPPPPVKKKVSSWRSFVSSLNELSSQLDPSDRTSIKNTNRQANEAEARNPDNTALGRNDSELPPDNTPELIHRKLGDIWSEPQTGIEFLWIPGGSFWMGSDKGERGRKEDEGPLHMIGVDGFWLGKYPVTWSQWKRVMGDPKGLFTQSKGEHPVERVLWDDTQNFLRKLSRLIGSRYRIRLPTEAEWEYAARAATKTTYYFGDDPARLGEYAWYAHNSGGSTQPVGLKPPNPWGLYDLLGNVWEWTEDWYAADYYEKSPKKNPRGAPYGEVRVRRGGSWRSNPIACRLAHRNQVTVSANSNALGIRLVRVDISE